MAHHETPYSGAWDQMLADDERQGGLKMQERDHDAWSSDGETITLEINTGAGHARAAITVEDAHRIARKLQSLAWKITGSTKEEWA